MRIVPVSVRIPEDVMKKIRDYAYWTPGMTITKFFVQALESKLQEIEHMEQEGFKDGNR